MRVLRVAHRLDPARGGPVNRVLELTRLGASAGMSTTILTRDPHGEAEESVQRALASLGADVVTVAARGNYSYARSLHRQLKGLVPAVDVVHAHSIYNYFTSSLLRFRTGDTPYLVEPHGALSRYYRGRSRVRKTVHEALIERPLLRSAAGVIVASEQERLHLLEEFRCSPIQLRRSVQVEGTSRPLRSGRLTLGYLGRLSHEKGFEILMPALTDLMRSREDIVVRFCGPGESEMVRESIEPWTDSMKANIEFVGARYGSEKWRFLESIDVLLVTSHSESFGTVIAEGAMAGCCVVATDQCGAREFFGSDELVTIEPSAAALYATLLRLADEPAHTRLIGERAQRRAEQAFSSRAAAAQLRDVYEHVAVHSRGSDRRPTDKAS